MTYDPDADPPAAGRATGACDGETPAADPGGGRAAGERPDDVSPSDTHEAPARLEIRYCGGCNPVIDRVALARSVADDPEATGTLYISGCVRACASGSQLRLEEGAAVVVAGEHVDGRPTAAPDLPEKVKQRLRESRTMKGS